MLQTCAGATRIPTGFIEFAADPDSLYYNDALKSDADMYLVCGAVGKAALAGKTLTEMGYAKVTNIDGIGDWKEAGGLMVD